MREIKFRAVRLDTGEWIYGDLHLHSPFPHIHSTRGDKAKIDTDTIGQFTCLHDKNGKEIYEGDILQENDSNRIVTVVYEAPQFCYADNDFGYKFLNLPENYVIIGNIHDNSKLAFQ